MIYKNIFYFDNINTIGGCETFFYYLAKSNQNKDITIVYSTYSGDLSQIRKLRKYARVMKYMGGVIECDKAFFNYSTDIIENIKAKEYIQIIHCDYIKENTKPNLHPKITRFIGVSKQVCESFTKVTGKPCELCYNPVAIDEPQPRLLLISATRLTWQKRKRQYDTFC